MMSISTQGTGHFLNGKPFGHRTWPKGNIILPIFALGIIVFDLEDCVLNPENKDLIAANQGGFIILYVLEI